MADVSPDVEALTYVHSTLGYGAHIRGCDSVEICCYSEVTEPSSVRESESWRH